MTKPDDDEVYVGVETCGKCPDIHLVVKVNSGEFHASVAMTEDEWQRLISDYHKLRQVQLSPGGGKLQ